MPRRRITELYWAELVGEGPIKGTPRLTVVQRRGLAYERQVGEMVQGLGIVGRLYLGQWIKYQDANGLGWAQPDVYIELEDSLLLIECKLTRTDSAVEQMLELYKPLLKRIYYKPISCLQICKFHQGLTMNMVGRLEDMLEPRLGAWVLHWPNFERLGVRQRTAVHA